MKDPQTAEPIEEEPEVPGYPDKPALEENSEAAKKEQQDKDRDGDVVVTGEPE